VIVLRNNCLIATMRVQVCLCLAALRAGCAAENEPSSFDLSEFTDFFDEDKDGKVSMAEVKAGIMDTNSDDNESRDPMTLIQESAAAFQATESVFKQADTDSDGSLTSEEIQNSDDFQDHMMAVVQNQEEDEDEDDEEAPGDVSSFNTEEFHDFFDRNKDGHISLAEVEAGLVEANFVQDQESEKEADASLVQEGERKAKVQEQEEEDSGYLAAIKAVFEVADTDKDGALSTDELKNDEVFQPGFDGKEFLEYFDTNQDGSASLNEIEDKLDNEDEELDSQDPRLQSALLEELDATKTAFDLADTNRDGLLSAGEVEDSHSFKQHILDSTGELEKEEGFGDDLYDGLDEDEDEDDEDGEDEGYGLEDYDAEDSGDDSVEGVEGLMADAESDGEEDQAGSDDLGLTEQVPQDDNLQTDLQTLENDVKTVEKLSDSASA